MVITISCNRDTYRAVKSRYNCCSESFVYWENGKWKLIESTALGDSFTIVEIFFISSSCHKDNQRLTDCCRIPRLLPCLKMKTFACEIYRLVELGNFYYLPNMFHFCRQYTRKVQSLHHHHHDKMVSISRRTGPPTLIGSDN